MAICIFAAAGLAQIGIASATNFGNYIINPKDDAGRFLPGFYPNVEFDLVYDDNIRRVPTGEESAMVAVLKPELQWISVVRKHSFRLGYQGNYGLYETDSDLSYDDHLLAGDVTFDLTPRLDVQLGAYYTQQHDGTAIAFGSTAPSLAAFNKPTEWEEWSVSAKGLYGRHDAKAQIALAAKHWERDYTNNGQEGRDYDADQVALTFLYNVGPKTRLIVEPVFATFDYTDPGNGSDNDVVKVLVGALWEATGKTTGEVKVGWVEKDYDNLPDESSYAIDAKVIWKPKTYSTVTMAVHHDIYDASGAAASGATSYNSLGGRVDWEHDLSKLTQLQAGVFYEDQSYNGIDRDDSVFSAYVGVSYALRRWLTVGARYDLESRDSDVTIVEYDDNRLTIGLKTRFD